MTQTEKRLEIVILGLSITSSWGNGHATTYRALVRELAARGHNVLFLECDKPWYAANRDLPCPPYGRTELYADFADLRNRFTREVQTADAVIVGSYVPDGIAVGRWVQNTARGVAAFYDIDTPVTLQNLQHESCTYLTPDLIPGYHLYLSFTGGPVLRLLEQRYGAPAARPLYCSVDAELYRPLKDVPLNYDLGYLGTWSADRQPTLDRLLVEPARRWPRGRFAVFGPQYPPELQWPTNVTRCDHLPPAEHARFYCAQRYTLNVTRADMIRAGYCPSVRLFEAAACGTPIISDWWSGLETLLEPGSEVLICQSADEVLQVLRDLPEDRRQEIARRGRARILARHTSAHRADELVSLLRQTISGRTAAVIKAAAPPPAEWVQEQRQ